MRIAAPHCIVAAVILAIISTSVLSAQVPPPAAQRSESTAVENGNKAILPGASAGSRRRDGFTIKADVNLVLVEATVRDRRGALVDNLTAGNFHLFENGVEQQISYFSRDELPLAVALVVDCSGSMGPALKQLHHAIYDILSPLKPDDEVALFDFAARAELLAGLTSDRRRIGDGIGGIHAEGGTLIPDALCDASEYLARAAPHRRHAVILFSDNANTLQGYADEKRVIREALESESVIYSIKVEQNPHPHKMYVILPIFTDVSVPKIVYQTGGDVIDAAGVRDIPAAIATSIARIKQRYTLGYYSTDHRLDGGFRTINVHVAAGSADSGGEYTVYSRQGYYARTQESSRIQP